ncbi:hypothetical protein SCLCIDRAFT_84591, partial [Scleroderma citrinum Foug A]
PDRGITRLLRLLISELAHLIWALRCENVIQGKIHTRKATSRKRLHKINQRLTL